MFQQSIQEALRWVAEDEASIEKMIELCYRSSQIFIEDRELQDFLADLKAGKTMSSAEYYDFFKKHASEF